MKIFYLVGSIIFTVLILIVAFGNVGAMCNYMNFLTIPVKQSPVMVILSVAIIGMICGAMYHAWIVRVLDSGDDETDDF